MDEEHQLTLMVWANNRKVTPNFCVCTNISLIQWTIIIGLNITNRIVINSSLEDEYSKNFDDDQCLGILVFDRFNMIC